MEGWLTIHFRCRDNIIDGLRLNQVLEETKDDLKWFLPWCHVHASHLRFWNAPFSYIEWFTKYLSMIIRHQGEKFSDEAQRCISTVIYPVIFFRILKREMFGLCIKRLLRKADKTKYVGVLYIAPDRNLKSSMHSSDTEELILLLSDNLQDMWDRSQVLEWYEELKDMVMCFLSVSCFRNIKARICC